MSQNVCIARKFWRLWSVLFDYLESNEIGRKKIYWALKACFILLCFLSETFFLNQINIIQYQTYRIYILGISSCFHTRRQTDRLNRRGELIEAFFNSSFGTRQNYWVKIAKRDKNRWENKLIICRLQIISFLFHLEPLCLGMSDFINITYELISNKQSHNAWFTVKKVKINSFGF
jgi:hypothetical protein